MIRTIEGSSNSTPLPAAKQEIFTLAGKHEENSLTSDEILYQNVLDSLLHLQHVSNTKQLIVDTKQLIEQALASNEVQAANAAETVTELESLAIKVTGILAALKQFERLLNDAQYLNEMVVSALHKIVNSADVKPKQQHYAPRHPVPKHAQLRHWARQHKISIEIDIEKLLQSMLPKFKFELLHDSGMAEFCAGLAHACEMYLHKQIAELDMPDTQPSVEETNNDTDATVRLPKGAIVTSKLDVPRLEAPHSNSRRPITMQDYVGKQNHHIPDNAHIVFTQQFKYGASAHTAGKHNCMMYAAYEHLSTKPVKPTTFSITIPPQIPYPFTAALKYLMLKTALFADCKMKHFLCQNYEQYLMTDRRFEYQVFQIRNNIHGNTYDAADLLIQLMPHKSLRQSQLMSNLISGEYTPYFWFGFEQFDVDSDPYHFADDYSLFHANRAIQWKTDWEVITNNKTSKQFTHIRNDSFLPRIDLGYHSFTEMLKHEISTNISSAHLHVKRISNLHFVISLRELDKLAHEFGGGIVDLKLSEAPFTSGFMRRNDDPLLLQWRYTETNSKADPEIVLPYPPGYAWWFIGLEMLKVEHDHNTIEQSLAQNHRYTFRNDYALYSTPDNTLKNEQELGVLTNAGLHVIMDAAARYDVYGVLTQTNMYTTMLFMWHTCVVHEMYRLLLSYLKMLCLVGYIKLEESAEEAMAQLFRDCCTEFRYLRPGTESWRDTTRYYSYSMNSTKQKLDAYIKKIQDLPHAQNHLWYAENILYCTSQLRQYLKQMPVLLMKSDSDRQVNIPHYIDDAIVAKFKNTMRHPAVLAMLELCSGNNISHNVYDDTDFDHATAAKLLHVLGVTPKSNEEISAQFHELLHERSRRARLSQASLVKQMWTTQATWRQNYTTENTDNNQHQAFADKKTMFVSDMTSTYHLYGMLGEQNIMQSLVLENAQNVRTNKERAQSTYVKSDFSFFMQIANEHVWRLRASQYQDASDVQGSDWFDVLPHKIASHQKIAIALNFLLMSKMVFCEWHEYGSRVLNSEPSDDKTLQTPTSQQQPAPRSQAHSNTTQEAEAAQRATEQQKEQERKKEEEDAAANKEMVLKRHAAQKAAAEEAAQKAAAEEAAQNAAQEDQKSKGQKKTNWAEENEELDTEQKKKQQSKEQQAQKKRLKDAFPSGAKTIEEYLNGEAKYLFDLCHAYQFTRECNSDAAHLRISTIKQYLTNFLNDRPFRTDPLIVLLLQTYHTNFLEKQSKEILEKQGKEWTWTMTQESDELQTKLYVFAEYWKKVLWRCLDKDHKQLHKKYIYWEKMKEACDVDDNWLHKAHELLGRDDTKGPWQGDIREFLQYDKQGQYVNTHVDSNGPLPPLEKYLEYS